MPSIFDLNASLWAVKRLMQHEHEYRPAAMQEFAEQQRGPDAEAVDRLCADLLTKWAKRVGW